MSSVPMECAEPGLCVSEKRDYFRSQIIAPPAGCFFQIQEILDLFRPNSVDWYKGLPSSIESVVLDSTGRFALSVGLNALSPTSAF